MTHDLGKPLLPRAIDIMRGLSYYPRLLFLGG